MFPTPASSRAQSGNIMVYVLLAVGLLAAITATMMSGGSNQAKDAKAATAATDLKAQLNVLIAAIEECTMNYPNQDVDLTSTEQKNAPYPINPKDTYFGVDAATTDEAAEIRCPGNPGGDSPGHELHAKIFGGHVGNFAPEPPAGFSPWVYYNGADGVYVMTAATSPDPNIKRAIMGVDALYHNCQTDVTDLRGIASVNMSSDVTPGDAGAKTCAGGAICFRYWFVQKASSLQNDTGGCIGTAHAHTPPSDNP